MNFLSFSLSLSVLTAAGATVVFGAAGSSKEANKFSSSLTYREKTHTHYIFLYSELPLILSLLRTAKVEV